MFDFYPVLTEDGTISLFNKAVNDVYHSKIGAYTEALNKFAVPSGILEFVKTHDEVNILDVCFGLGYNSKVAISEIWKINPNCKINLTGIEIDPDVLAFSCLTGFPAENKHSKESFNFAISKLVDVKSFIEKKLTPEVKDLLKIDALKQTDEAEHLFRGYKTSFDGNQEALLHNIYYQTISNRNKIIENVQYKTDMLNISLYLCDARDIIKELSPHYDYIFHDPFTPYKAPALWTVDFFRELYRLLQDDGNLTTYSSSSAAQSGMIEAGFHVGLTENIGRKSSGTIAYKNIALIENHLPEKEKGLLNTNAGIAYYDADFSFNTEEILNFRRELQKKSSRLSSSKYLKKFYNTEIW